MHKSRLSAITRNPRSVGAVLLALISVSTQMIALASASGWTLRTADNRATMAAAVIRSLQCAGDSKPQGCPVAAPSKLAGSDDHEHVVVPSGAKPCPDSGPGAACISQAPAPDSGNSAVPEGLPACPKDPTKAIPGAPGSCATLPAAPAPAAPTTPTAVAPTTQAGGEVHVPSPAAPTSDDTLTLTSSGTLMPAGGAIRLDAKSSFDVSGTPYSIEIFDVATGGLVAACTESSECQVSFSARSGAHSFVAYVVPPTQAVPTNGIQLASDKVDVRWLGVTLAAASPAIVAPGKEVTFTASATEEVGEVGYRIEIHDKARPDARLTFCSHGTTCSTSLVEPTGGVHTLVATLEPQAADLAGAIHPQSGPASATWLAVRLAATASRPSDGGMVSLEASANADLRMTPYSLFLFDRAGKQVGDACHAATCAASEVLPPGAGQTFVAVIAGIPGVQAGQGPLANVLHQLPVDLSGLDVQVGSQPVKPTQTMWGVDSCKRITQDASGNTGLLPAVTRILGAPDFWGRYLPNTGNCAGLNSDEIAAAHSRHIAILPIFNDYDCSAVSGNATGAAYAHSAIGWLQNDLIPQGTGIAIDIEPPGDACPGAARVDSAFIQGWYDTLMAAGYVPAYYGNSAPGSEFANAWCNTVRQRPEIADNSYLWSFEPSLMGNFAKRNTPGFSPYNAGCAGHYAAWQYVLSSGGNPDVDQDEASSAFPFWYP